MHKACMYPVVFAFVGPAHEAQPSQHWLFTVGHRVSSVMQVAQLQKTSMPRALPLTSSARSSHATSQTPAHSNSPRSAVTQSPGSRSLMNDCSSGCTTRQPSSLQPLSTLLQSADALQHIGEATAGLASCSEEALSSLSLQNKRCADQVAAAMTHSKRFTRPSSWQRRKAAELKVDQAKQPGRHVREPDLAWCCPLAR